MSVVAPLPWELRLALVEDVAAAALEDARELLRRHETVRPGRQDRCVRNELATEERTVRELRDGQ